MANKLTNEEKQYIENQINGGDSINNILTKCQLKFPLRKPIFSLNMLENFKKRIQISNEKIESQRIIAEKVRNESLKMQNLRNLIEESEALRERIWNNSDAHHLLDGYNPLSAKSDEKFDEEFKSLEHLQQKLTPYAASEEKILKEISHNHQLLEALCEANPLHSASINFTNRYLSGINSNLHENQSNQPLQVISKEQDEDLMDLEKEPSRENLKRRINNRIRTLEGKVEEVRHLMIKINEMNGGTIGTTGTMEEEQKHEEKDEEIQELEQQITLTSLNLGELIRKYQKIQTIKEQSSEPAAILLIGPDYNNNFFCLSQNIKEDSKFKDIMTKNFIAGTSTQETTITIDPIIKKRKLEEK